MTEAEAMDRGETHVRDGHVLGHPVRVCYGPLSATPEGYGSQTRRMLSATVCFAGGISRVSHNLDLRIFEAPQAEFDAAVERHIQPHQLDDLKETLGT